MFGMLTGLIRMILTFVYADPECGEPDTRPSIIKDVTELVEKNTKIATELPVVFVSVFEHNSNLLPWRESGAIIETIPLTDDGDFDYEYLVSKLKSY